ENPASSLEARVEADRAVDQGQRGEIGIDDAASERVGPVVRNDAVDQRQRPLIADPAAGADRAGEPAAVVPDDAVNDGQLAAVAQTATGEVGETRHVSVADRDAAKENLDSFSSGIDVEDAIGGGTGCCWGDGGAGLNDRRVRPVADDSQRVRDVE